MRRFDGDEYLDEDEGSTPPETGGGPPLWVRAVRVLLLSVVAAIPIIPAAFLLMPMPRGADGITLCMPLIGPMQQFAPDMEPDLEEMVQIHERIHADQCRRMGAFRYARTYLDAEGLITLEAEAFCAEARTLAMRGLNTGPWVSRIIETLYYDYPHDEGVTYPDVLRIVGASCPPPDERSRLGVRP